MRGEHEQRCSLRATERAREAATVQFDCFEHAATLSNSHAALAGDVRIPHSTFRIESDAVRKALGEVGPDASVGQATVDRDVERGQPVGVGLDNG